MAWYKDLFAGEDPVRLESYSESDKSRREVDFVIEKLGLQPGAGILDLCCGQGRHLLDLLRRGYDVVGVDLSEYMLSKCREIASQQGVEPRLIQADMREIDFRSEFDAAVILWTSFGYLESDDEDQKVLDAVSRSLKPGGRLLIDSHNLPSLMKRWMPRNWFQNSRGETVLADRRYDMFTGRIEEVETTLRPDGSLSEQQYSLRIYTCPEISRMLEAAGMSLETVYGGFDGSEYTMESRHMITVACKPG